MLDLGCSVPKVSREKIPGVGDSPSLLLLFSAVSHPLTLQGLGSPISLERGPLITCQGTDQQLPSFRGSEGHGVGTT